MTISHIVAVALNGVIGASGTLPWDLPEDLRFFREKTVNHAIIMGRRTFESIGRPLPRRLNVVITRQENYAANFPGIVTKPSFESARAYCATRLETWGNEVFIIGGGEIYRESMDFADRLYVTRIQREFDGTVFYPDIDPEKFALIESRDHVGPIPFTFQEFRRR